ncbi:four helix bundle protein [Candidatus Gracilibacteria bacterium]|nr:four helix bundle protein [Candidatus Gracilibacteria bacterium]
MFDFEKFPVYQKSESFYKKVLGIIADPKIDKNTKDQLKRSALSIVLNIAEGAGKYSKNDKKNFYVVAKGSTNECVAILRILKIENLIPENEFRENYEALLEIAKMLSGLIGAMIKK